ncbi:hypothetical protein EAI30_08970 [Romboutsia ilealis]|nr:hypothetical protein [Romboutsia ilealis]
MKDSISFDSTIKIFENGVIEINKLKSAIIKLNDTVGELTNFNEILDLEIDSSKIEDINKKLDITIAKHKQTLNLFEDCISVLNEENKIKSNSIKLGIDNFYKEVENLSNNISSIDFNLNNNIIDNLIKNLGDFIKDIENKYKEISYNYIEIETLTEKTNNLLITVNRINKIIESTKFCEKIEDTLNKIEELELKYNRINELIERFDKNINKVNKDFTEDKILTKTDNILKDLEVFNKNVHREYEKIELKYNDINLLNEKINNTYEERIKGLEEKIDLLIDENKALKLAYSTREIEDNIFKDEIVSLIKDSIYSMERNYVEVKADDIDKLKQLAKQGDINASFKLAQKYYQGNNVNKNIDLAVRYYMIGAKCNHTESINELINIYMQEASNGNVKYQRALGMEYIKGNLTDENIKEGIKWLTIASENGSQEAKNKLDKIKSEYN